MGLFAFLIFAVVAVLACAAAVWVIDYLAPGHPAIIDKLIWVLCVVIIVLMLASAVGLFSHDIQIPRVR